EAGLAAGVGPGASDGFAPDTGVPDPVIIVSDLAGSDLPGSGLRGLSLAESFLPGAEGLLGDFVT
ncbi:MAG TPA: hypothetical protein VLQ65_06715, partial [Saliniramus sp.]|nr:hypothetical protein [Saliniramus sp.]